MTAPPDPVRRRTEIEDPTNLFVIHPVANRLVPVFARWGVTPNAASLAGMLFGILAGVAYHFSHRPGLALLGFVLMIAWHVMDGVDGQLARLTRTHSEFGKALDGICDYTTFGAVYIGLALGHGPSVWLLALASGACHAVQSAIYEVQRQNYLFVGCGQASAAFTAPATRVSGRLPPHRRVADALLGAYLRLQHVALGADAEARARFALLLARHPERAEALRADYRHVFAPALRRWSLMSANTRTVAIFVFAAVGAPVLFFAFEIVVLGAILLALLRWQRRLYARLFTSPVTTG